MQKRGLIYIYIALLLVLVSCSKKEKEGTLSSIEDLRGKTVAVCVGSIHDTYLSINYPDINLMYMDVTENLVLPVLNGHADAGMAGLTPLKIAQRTHEELALLGVGYIYSEVAIPFSDAKMRDEFNKYLAQVRESGHLDELIEKWLRDKESAEMPDFNFTGENGELKIGVTLPVPYIFIRDGQYCGLEIELIYGFCEQQKLRPKVSTYNFSALLTALATKQLDAVCSIVAVTPERKAKILFSDPYTELPAGIIVQKKNLAKGAGVLGDEEELQSGQKGAEKGFWSGIKSVLVKNIIEEKRYLIVLEGMKNTILISFFSLLIGTLLGALFCWMKLSKKRVLKEIAMGITEVVRGIPQVVLLMIMFYIVLANSSLGGIAVASITFALYFGSTSSEVFRSAISRIDIGQTEGGLALGFSKFKTFCLIVAPQAARIALPMFKGQVGALVKSTSIVGYIAVEDLTKAGDIIRSRTFEAFIPLLIVTLLYYVLAKLFVFCVGEIGKKIEM